MSHMGQTIFFLIIPFVEMKALVLLLAMYDQLCTWGHFYTNDKYIRPASAGWNFLNFLVIDSG